MAKLFLLLVVLWAAPGWSAEVEFTRVIRLRAPTHEGRHILARQGTEARQHFDANTKNRCAVNTKGSDELIDARGHRFCKLYLKDERAEVMAGELEWADQSELLVDPLSGKVVMADGTTNFYCLFFYAIRFSNITCGIPVTR